MRAKKSLGQNFLKSERALSTIVEAGQVNETDTILEIGPGTGVLTQRLLDTGAKVMTIEKDDELVKKLQEKYQREISLGQLILIHGDILDFDFSHHLLAEMPYKLIANIPYNITGAIFKKFLEIDNQPKRIVLLVQKEVAERIVARDKKESILSISIKAYGMPKYVETVKAGSFVPRPKVDSAIISVENISKDYFQGFSEKDFFNMVRAGFKAKRKKLSSNLSTIFRKDRVEKAFLDLGLDQNLRAEDANIGLWQKLAQNLANVRRGG